MCQVYLRRFSIVHIRLPGPGTYNLGPGIWVLDLGSHKTRHMKIRLDINLDPGPICSDPYTQTQMPRPKYLDPYIGTHISGPKCSDPGPIYPDPNTQTHISGPICMDPYVWTQIFSPGTRDPYTQTQMRRPICMDPYVRTHNGG